MRPASILGFVSFYSVVSFLCEGNFISICSSGVRGVFNCLPSNLSKPCRTLKIAMNSSCLLLILFWGRVLHSPGWLKTYDVAEGWHLKYHPPASTTTVLGSECVCHCTRFMWYQGLNTGLHTKQPLYYAGYNLSPLLVLSTSSSLSLLLRVVGSGNRAWTSLCSQKPD